MLRRLEDALLQRIDAVARRGFAFVEWWELNSWYGVERISKNVWRDLRTRFLEVAQEGADLAFCEAPNGVMLINSMKLRSISDKTGEPD
jgi:hypothetical protein